jgi:hypothetical protein
MHRAHDACMSDSPTPIGGHGAGRSAAERDHPKTHSRDDGEPPAIAGTNPRLRTNRTDGFGSTQLSHLDIEAIASALARTVAEAVAQRVLELVDERQASELVDAAELARALGVDREWVYEHSNQLGAIRFGAGPRPRLRFELARAVAAFRDLSAERRVVPPPAGAQTPVPRPRRSRERRR